MRRPRLGLQSRFIAAIVALLGVVVLALVLLWQRQQASRHEVSEATRRAMHGLLSEQVRMDGEAEVRQVADALANPLYYFDLDAIGGDERIERQEPERRRTVDEDRVEAVAQGIQERAEPALAIGQRD